MSHVVWDQVDERTFEAGVERGVLYFPEGGGVAWNGLTSIEEHPSTTLEPIYFDGVKFGNVATYGDFSATLRAFTYPDEFLFYEGIYEEQVGFYLADQPQNLFHLSYRTNFGDGKGYKLHMLWNLTAIPADKQYATLSLDTTPTEFEWELTAIPEPVDGYRPTAHVVLDSRSLDPYLLEDVETILYGDPADPDRQPTMPSLKGFISFMRKWDRLIITDNGDGTWTATANTEGIIEMLDSTTFQITSDTAIYLDPPTNETYEISSSEKNEEDI